MDDNKHNKLNPDTGFYLPDLSQVKAVLFIVLVAELLAIVLTLNNSSVVNFDWQGFALKSLFCQWAFLSSAAALCRLRPWLGRLSLAAGAAISYSLIVTLITLLAIVGQWQLTSAIQSGEWSLNIASLIDTVIIAAILAGIALRYFYLSQQLQRRQQAELQARIQALQSRIRPHFLFNSMNIIASLIAVDQQAAEKAVEDLASLFRASLSDSNTQGTLQEELELCQSYARIEQNRLGHRLKVAWQTHEVPQRLAMPCLTLQPLLENAIYHGIQNLVEGGTVSVEAVYDNQWLTVTISNPYNPKQGHHSGNQMAIPNIEHRLKALYGEKASLVTERSENNSQHLYRVTVSYPVTEEGDA
ncbi:MAG: two-component system sensor histidine kinase AlgZ [Pseudohongiellaceae bacterium]|jgi:two-component system sensor histidine kinase AlgZ